MMRILVSSFEFWQIIWRSLYVSTIGTAIAALIALPLAYLFVTHKFAGKSFLQALMQALIALPPVVVGLGLYAWFSADGALGLFNWLYSVPIMILAQFILVMPIIFSLCVEELNHQHKIYRKYLACFPKNDSLHMRILFHEGRFGILTAIMAGFGRAIGEVGAVIIVGGNIHGLTQVMTTVIVEETSKGNIGMAMKYGWILVAVAIVISLFVFSYRASKEVRNDRA